MRSKIIWIIISVIIALSMVLASCAEKTTTTTLPTTTSKQATSPTTTTVTETDWWDKFGEPKYGGTINLHVTSLMSVFDTYAASPNSYFMWLENMFSPDWTANPEEWGFKGAYIPFKYMKGQLVESWEQPDTETLVLHVNKSARWQNKEPVNGRAVKASDLAYFYNRLCGLGDGYTEPPPMYASLKGVVEKVTVTDDYTLTVKFAEPAGVGTLWNFITIDMSTRIEAPELLEANGGHISDWKTVVGTGAWILTNFVGDSSETYNKNPDYYGYDERHPKNKLPYADQLKVLCIPDTSTALAALRTGKLDIISDIDFVQAGSLANTNSELKQVAFSAGQPGINMRIDLKPFDDIRVRKALNMSINRADIAAGYYKSTVTGIPAGNNALEYVGFSYPYNEWTQSLKDEYSYNTAKAKELLAEAGYSDGFKCNMLANSTSDLQLAAAIKDYFLAVGVDITISSADIATFQSVCNADKHPGLVYQNGGGTSGPLFLLAHAFWSKDFRQDYSEVNSAEYDSLFDDFSNAATEDEAAAAMKAMDKMGLEQHWKVQVFPINSFTIYQPYLKGFNGELMNAVALGGFYPDRWWIDQD